jgi:protease-4
MLLGGIVSLFSSEEVSVPNDSILKIDLAEDFIEAPSNDPLAGVDFRSMNVTKQITLFSALQAIDAAKQDDRIKGIYIRPNGGGDISLAELEELRVAIDEFKQESGKFVIAYNELYTQGLYYLSSVADAIYLQPQGLLDWHGIAFNTMFYKGLLDKLHIQAEVFRPTACKYKSAVEPYILDKMSDANREQMQQLVSSLWGTITTDIAATRGITVDALNSYADELSVILPKDALEKGLIDGLKYEDEINDIFAEKGVQQRDDAYNFISLAEYASQLTEKGTYDADRIAIVYADGEIVDGEGSDAVYGNTLAMQLKKIRQNNKVKAVVLRVNSPGGSALASDVIWREVELLKAEKPVIVSMGSYAASGGYYISCPADAIVADRMTLTGSIGVFGIKFDLGDALQDKLGIQVDGVKSNRSADMSAYRVLTPVERAMMIRQVDAVYDTFTNNVAQGRNLKIEQVLDIAGGRVWSGTDALNIGLVDTCGGIRNAIAVAADKAGLEKFQIEEVTAAPEGLAALFSVLNTRIETYVERTTLHEMYQDCAYVKRFARHHQGVRAECPYRFVVE